MMAEKARLFDDLETAQAAISAGHPAQVQRLGRRVRGFDQSRWDQHKVDIVMRGNLAKFSQNPDLGQYLAGTGQRILVEASPKDHIWGVGLAESDAAITDPRRWRGQNLLGFTLMAVRSQL
jgi:ribA/ribD-fused uncharacterized protein